MINVEMMLKRSIAGVLESLNSRLATLLIVRTTTTNRPFAVRAAKIFQDFIPKQVLKKVFQKIICGKKGGSLRTLYFCRRF